MSKYKLMLQCAYVACQFSVTSHTTSPFSLNQYLSLSGGCTTVPVMGRVTGLGCTDVSALMNCCCLE